MSFNTSRIKSLQVVKSSNTNASVQSECFRPRLPSPPLSSPLPSPLPSYILSFHPFPLHSSPFSLLSSISFLPSSPLLSSMSLLSYPLLSSLLSFPLLSSHLLSPPLLSSISPLLLPPPLFSTLVTLPLPVSISLLCLSFFLNLTQERIGGGRHEKGRGQRGGRK